MTKRKTSRSDGAGLRDRAVKLLKTRARQGRSLADSSTDRRIQELEIQRVEIELQNEELRSARAELEAGLDKYVQLFDFAPIGYATLRSDRTVSQINHVGAKILCESRSRVIDKHFAQFISPAGRTSFDELIEKVSHSDQSETRDFDLLTGRTERLSARVTVAGPSVASAEILIAFEDVTARKLSEEQLLQAEAKLRQADRRKDEFLAVLSHELRTPLSTLLMYGQLLREGHLDEPTTRTAANAIENAARAQARLIDDLLDVSRIVAGKLSMEMGKVSIVAVARAALASISKEAERKEIRLVAHLNSTTPAIVGDAARLLQVITNLLNNAIKFTPRDGEIRISVEPVGRRVCIEVADTGAGIAPDFLPHIFERFSQGDRSTTRFAGGLGLGLSIARSIVDAHQGTLAARSEGPGKGTVFAVSLPMGAPHVAVLAPAVMPPITVTNGIKGRRLLVVEDDDGTRETLKAVLSFAGADVRCADGGNAAMRVLQEFHPDALICDIAIPDEDGCALLRRLRRHRKNRDIRAVALTAFAGKDDRARTRDAGFEMHLVKPVDVDRLIMAISSLWTGVEKRSHVS